MPIFTFLVESNAHDSERNERVFFVGCVKNKPETQINTIMWRAKKLTPQSEII